MCSVQYDAKPTGRTGRRTTLGMLETTVLGQPQYLSTEKCPEQETYLLPTIDVPRGPGTVGPSPVAGYSLLSVGRAAEQQSLLSGNSW